MNTPIIPASPFIQQALEEFIERFPQWANKNMPRVRYAADAVKSGWVTPAPIANRYVVQSNSEMGASHLVDPQAKSCTCEWGMQNKTCIHRLQVHFAIRGMELETQYRQELAAQAQNDPQQFQVCEDDWAGTWDLIDTLLVHVCSDGYSGASIMGVGNDLYCYRCNEQVPQHLGVHESGVTYEIEVSR